MRCNAQLRDISNGDRQAFNALYREWHRRLTGFATALVAGDKSAAEDIVNEAFLAIWTQASSFNGSGSAEGWMRRIVRNKAVDWIRKQRETSMTSAIETRILEESTNEDSDPYMHAVKADNNSRLHNALTRLSIDHREAIWLCYFEERPLAEIAELTQCPENTVKTRLFHARKILAKPGMLDNHTAQ
jgi:RNA polymerase sigma-70 factor (ECF subfamily)